MDKRILSKFKQDDPNAPIIFIGDHCEVSVLKKYEQYGCLQIGNSVRTLGVFDMVVDGIQSGMFLTGHIEMFPSDTMQDNSEERPMVKLIFKNGDVFMKTSNIVINDALSFIVWSEYVKFANTLKAMNYEDYAWMFDRVSKVTGAKFPVTHTVFEAILTHLTRLPENFATFYRHTDMDGNYHRLPLSDVAHAAISTTAKITGAYFTDGLNAALVNENDLQSPIENILRK